MPWSCSHCLNRLLGIPRFRSRFHSSRYRLEAPDEKVEEVLAEPSAVNGYLVRAFSISSSTRHIHQRVKLTEMVPIVLV